MDHFYGFLGNCTRGSFQINLFGNWNDKYVVFFAFALHDKRFVSLGNRGAGGFGRMNSIYKFVTFISQQFIGDFISFQNTHGIGFYFFSHDIHLRAQYIIFRGKVEQ